jgi:dipeptidyl aminopeptidase/acylaminoacyl peptidase
MELAWFPDGDHLLVNLAVGWDERHDLPSRARGLFRVGWRRGTWTRLDDGEHVLSDAVPSPDGSGIAFLRRRGGIGTVNADREVAVLTPTDGRVRVVSEDIDRSFDAVGWSIAGDALHVTFDARGQRRVGRLALAGGLTDRAWSGASAFAGPDRRDGLGVLVASSERPSAPAILRDDGTVQLLTAAGLPPGGPVAASTRSIHYASAHPDRLGIHAVVATPPGVDDPSRLPVVVDLHGGPYDASRSAFDIDREVLAGAGYVVVQPNYRGSRGFGEAFLQLSDRRHYPGWADDPHAPHEMGLDVVGVLDAIREQRLGDPGRVFLRGHSAGALLATWVIGRSTAFRAAVARSWYPGEWTSTHYGWYQGRRYFAGPLSDPEVAATAFRRSPLALAGRVRTPLLLVHGEVDAETPLGEVERYYYLLKDHGAPVTLMVIPDDDHDLGRHPSSHRTSLAAELAWFREHGGIGDGVTPGEAPPTA